MWLFGLGWWFLFSTWGMTASSQTYKAMHVLVVDLDLWRCNIDSSGICMSDHRDDGHHTRFIANCACSWMCSYKNLETMQIDLGTDAKHCFCKAGDLLAVVEWHLCVSAYFDKTNSIQRGTTWLFCPCEVKRDLPTVCIKVCSALGDRLLLLSLFCAAKPPFDVL